MVMDIASDDGSLDSAVLAITAKLKGGGDDLERKDTRENRTDRDTIEQDTSTDLEESEREQREQRAEQNDGEKPAEAEGEDGEEAGAEADAYIELPAAEDGAEPEKVPLTEAVEAVKQLRQMNGEIATAVIRAEEEAFQKQDQITQQLGKTFETVRDQAKVALQIMHAYAPQPPDPIMIDRNSGYYDPEGYHNAKIHYDAFVAHYNKVNATLKQAEGGLEATSGQQDTEVVRRETERAARFIPEFKDPATREARKAEILDALSRYGVTKEDLAEVTDHKAWRMMNDLANSLKQAKAAPEVRKHVQEKAAKLVKGKLPPRNESNGRFVGKEREQLRNNGTEDDFVRLMMKGNALKGF